MSISQTVKDTEKWISFLRFEYSVYYSNGSYSVSLEVISRGILCRVPRENQRRVLRSITCVSPCGFPESLRNPRRVPRGTL